MRRDGLRVRQTQSVPTRAPRGKAVHRLAAARGPAVEKWSNHFSTDARIGFWAFGLNVVCPRAPEAPCALVARSGPKPDSPISPGPDCAPQPTGAQPCTGIGACQRGRANLGACEAACG